MGILTRNKSFLLTAFIILVVGAFLFAGVTGVRVLASQGTATTAAVPQKLQNNNGVSSYGKTGFGPIKIVPTADTPKFVSSRLADQRGIVLLVYVEGATADMELRDSFDAVKAIYAADISFFSFESHQVTELGDLLGQLGVSNPPILAIIRGDGTVSELYTGWVDRTVLEQRVADAVRGL
jgi:hypothetical protein